jgi:hypothetical protein
MGYSTNYSKPEPNGVRHLVKITSGPVDHMINIYTVRSLFQSRLGFDLKRKITIADWLTFPQQRLLEFTDSTNAIEDLALIKKLRTAYR